MQKDHIVWSVFFQLEFTVVTRKDLRLDGNSFDVGIEKEKLTNRPAPASWMLP